jgi:peptidase E
LNLALTSDFPSTANHDLVARIHAVSRNPRIAWVAPSPSTGRPRFLSAQVAFRALGVEHLEYVDIDSEPTAGQFALLDLYDVVYLTGGDPIVFRQNLQRSGFATRLRDFAAAGRLVVGASGGAMQLTKNVSLFRLSSDSVDDVVSKRAEFDGLGLVGYELLPHLNKHDASFLEKVRRYSESIPHDIVALEDGAALLCDDDDDCRCFGQGVRYRGGVWGSIEAAGRS